jgi:hypothetical protein
MTRVMAIEHDAPNSRAFFGRRKGHRLRPRQAALLQTLLPRLALDLAVPSFARSFPSRSIRYGSRSVSAAASTS